MILIILTQRVSLLPHSFHGDGSNLNWFSRFLLFLTVGGATKVEAVSTGATVTGNLDVSGNINAASITGDGSNLTGVGGLGDPQGATK